MKYWGLLVIVLVVGGCGDDRGGTTDAGLDAPVADVAIDTPLTTATICHIPTDDPQHPVLLDVSSDEVASHVAHGDPIGVANLLTFVGPASPGGLGTQAAPFGRITDALALQRCRFRATGEPGVIRVAAGAHTVSYDATALANNPSFEPGPIIVDFPVRLRGATAISLDGSNRPVADYTLYNDTNSTLLVPDAPLGPADTQPMFLVADTRDVTIQGFVLSAGHCHIASLCPGQSTVTDRGGTGFILVRSDGISLRGNVLHPGFFSGIDSRGTSVTVTATYASDASSCVACMSGPGRIEVLANRFDNGLGGVSAGPTVANVPFSLGTQQSSFTIAQFSPPPSSTTDIVIDNNVLSGHTRNATAFGVRLVVYGKDTAATMTHQILTAHVHGNRIEDDAGGNGATQGILIDSGFTNRLATGTLTGTLVADIRNNTITVPGAKVSVMNMRAQALLNSDPTLWKTYAPLDASTLLIDSDLTYPSQFRVDHFASDPLAGNTTAGNTCSTDADCSSATYRSLNLPGSCNTTSSLCECLPGFTNNTGTCSGSALANVLVINGAVIPAGTAIP